MQKTYIMTENEVKNLRNIQRNITMFANNLFPNLERYAEIIKKEISYPEFLEYENLTRGVLGAILSESESLKEIIGTDKEDCRIENLVQK